MHRPPRGLALRALGAGVALLTLSCCGSGGGGSGVGDAVGTYSSRPSSPSPVAGGATLDGRRFAGATLVGRRLAPGTTVRIDFARGALSADAGCNRLTGGYSFDGRTLSVSTLHRTGLACPPGLQAQDSWLVALLSSRPAVTLEGASLTIGSASARVTVHEEHGQELLGTTWAIEGTSDGGGTRPLPAGAPASLTFDGNGEHGSVRTGCSSGGLAVSSLSGQAQGRGVMVLRPTVVSRIACRGELMLVQQSILRVLSGSVHYTVDGDTLTLVNDAPGGHGLTLRTQ